MAEHHRQGPSRQGAVRVATAPDIGPDDAALPAADACARPSAPQLALPDVVHDGDGAGGAAVGAERCCGLDEVGRGALAGPLVAAAAILPDDIHARLGPLARFLRDSKTVPVERRRAIAVRLREHALALQIVVIPVAAINARGIGWANKEAFRRLIALLHADEYVVDGRVRPPAPRARAGRVRCLVQADAQVPAVSAAALVAKVHRDGLMTALHERHPAYGWATNVGYGTPAHLAALREHGPCPEHRMAFVATALGLASAPPQSPKRRRTAGPPLFPDE